MEVEDAAVPATAAAAGGDSSGEEGVVRMKSRGGAARQYGGGEWVNPFAAALDGLAPPPAPLPTDAPTQPATQGGGLKVRAPTPPPLLLAQRPPHRPPITSLTCSCAKAGACGRRCTTWTASRPTAPGAAAPAAAATRACLAHMAARHGVADQRLPTVAHM